MCIRYQGERTIISCSSRVVLTCIRRGMYFVKMRELIHVLCFMMMTRRFLTFCCFSCLSIYRSFLPSFLTSFIQYIQVSCYLHDCHVGTVWNDVLSPWRNKHIIISNNNIIVVVDVFGDGLYDCHNCFIIQSGQYWS